MIGRLERLAPRARPVVRNAGQIRGPFAEASESGPPAVPSVRDTD